MNAATDVVERLKKEIDGFADEEFENLVIGCKYLGDKKEFYKSAKRLKKEGISKSYEGESDVSKSSNVDSSNLPKNLISLLNELRIPRVLLLCPDINSYMRQRCHKRVSDHEHLHSASVSCEKFGRQLAVGPQYNSMPDALIKLFDNLKAEKRKFLADTVNKNDVKEVKSEERLEVSGDHGEEANEIVQNFLNSSEGNGVENCGKKKVKQALEILELFGTNVRIVDSAIKFESELLTRAAKESVDYLQHIEGYIDKSYFVEIFNFPYHLRTAQIKLAVAELRVPDFSVVWVDDTHALAVYESPEDRDYALRTYDKLGECLKWGVKVRKLRSKTCDVKSMEKSESLIECHNDKVDYKREKEEEFQSERKERRHQSAFVAKRLIRDHLGIQVSERQKKTEVDQLNLDKIKLGEEKIDALLAADTSDSSSSSRPIRKKSSGKSNKR